MGQIGCFTKGRVMGVPSLTPSPSLSPFPSLSQDAGVLPSMSRRWMMTSSSTSLGM